MLALPDLPQFMVKSYAKIVKIETEIMFHPTRWVLGDCDSLYSAGWLKLNLGLDFYCLNLNYSPFTIQKR